METPTTVLVIDDDPMSLELVAMFLEGEGFVVTTAGSGEEAVALLRKSAVDVVLTDMQMPGLSGTQLAAAVRETRPKARLISMSATRPHPEVLKSFDGFLQKPFDGAAFSDALKNLGSNAEVVAVASEVAEVPLLNRVIYDKLAASMKPEQLQELFVVCLEDSRRRVELMREMNPTSDGMRFKAEAHAIKGACSMIGAARMAAIAAELERGEVGGHDLVDAALDEFLRQCDVLEGMLIGGE
jgi:CheY-like chemotaxis protein